MGLINIESKNENDTEIHKSGLSIHEYVEIAVVIIIAQRKAKAALKKKNSLKEMMAFATVPGPGMIVKTINQQIPMKEMSQIPQEENLERQLVPVNPQKSNQILPVNIARMPLFPNSYYN